MSSDICDKDLEKHDHERSISKKTRWDLDWFRLSQRVIALRPVLMYYAVKKFIKLVAPDELQSVTYIDWRIDL
jgi:hypothetical protein